MYKIKPPSCWILKDELGFKIGVGMDFEVGKKYKSIKREWAWSGYRRLRSPVRSQLMSHSVSDPASWSVSSKLQEFIKGFYIRLEVQSDLLRIPFAPGTILSNLFQLTHFPLTTSLRNRCDYYLSSFTDEETDAQSTAFKESQYRVAETGFRP